MELNEIIVFFICILVVLFMQIPLLILGNSNDCYFSDKTIKKLTVPQKSVLRKLVVFKEAKSANPQFLYIRVIPYLIQLFIVIVSTILFFINQFLISFIPSIVFMIIGYGTLGLNVIYELVLISLSRGLRI
ncbi:MAG: hypothetical protein HPY96_05800 [Bacilli bacterium]|jgi:hypothetical protein|nr:hypothetical protein [Bacilli bacterium]